MKIKLICTDCKKEFSCEEGKELKTHCPRCGSGNITIPIEPYPTDSQQLIKQKRWQLR